MGFTHRWEASRFIEQDLKIMLKFFDFKLRKYKKIRKFGMPLMTEISKTVPSELFLQAASDLMLLGKDNKTITMENESEVSFIMDRAIHDIPWPKQRWIEYIIEQKIQDYIPEQQSFLKAHLQPFISLYELLKTDYDRGVYLHDLFNHQELFLMDIGLGTTGSKGMLLATRVITFAGLNFTAGVAMPFGQEYKKQLVEYFISLYEKKKSEITWEEMMRKYAPYFFIEFKKRNSTIEFTDITKEPLQKNEELENYQEEPIPIKKSTKVGRNDHCPCGSGKKYKKCCMHKNEDQTSANISVWDYAFRKSVIKHSDDFPVEQCLINSKWQESGLANIVITRSHENGTLIVGVFLVDIFCIGMKNTFCNVYMPVEEFETKLLRKCYQEQEPVTIGINYAKEIIFGAIGYARKLGFEPQEDFKLSKYVLGTEEVSYLHHIRFGGPEGKPLYVAGPDDDYKKIVRQLTERLGEDNFNFILPEE